MGAAEGACEHEYVSGFDGGKDLFCPYSFEVCIHDPRFPVHIKTGLVWDGQSAGACTSYCLGFKHKADAAQ